MMNNDDVAIVIHGLVMVVYPPSWHVCALVLFSILTTDAENVI